MSIIFLEIKILYDWSKKFSGSTLSFLKINSFQSIKKIDIFTGWNIIKNKNFKL